MSDERRDVIGSLPSTRPHRRSQKRGPAAGQTDPSAKQPRTADAPGKRTPAPKASTARKPPAAKASTAKKPAAARKAAATKPPAAAKAPTRATPRRPTAKRPTAKKPPANIRTRTPAAPTPSPVTRPAEEHGTLETVVQAAAELTELGLRAGARALRAAVSRLPRP